MTDVTTDETPEPALSAADEQQPNAGRSGQPVSRDGSQPGA